MYTDYISVKQGRKEWKKRKKQTKNGLHSQPKYWLRTSVLVHPQRLQPNSRAVSLVSWLELQHQWGRVSCSCRQAREQGVRKSGKAWVSSALAPLALGSRGNLTSSRSQHRASSKPCRYGEVGGGQAAGSWARAGEGLPGCPHDPHTTTLHPSQQSRSSPFGSDHKGWNLTTWELISCWFW